MRGDTITHNIFDVFGERYFDYSGFFSFSNFLFRFLILLVSFSCELLMNKVVGELNQSIKLNWVIFNFSRRLDNAVEV